MPKPHYLLYADDDPDDRFIVSQALESTKLSIEIREARNGLEAIDILQEAKENQHYPSLIILDMNMPGMNGKETVKAIRSDPEMVNIPMAILTTLSSPIDMKFCKGYGVACVMKPLCFNDLVDLLAKL